MADSPEIVRKRLEEAQVRRTMAPAESKAWSDWARGIARSEACKIGAEVMELNAKGFKHLVDRLDQLEAEVGRLRGQQPDREEWPLRVVDGGKR